MPMAILTVDEVNNELLLVAPREMAEQCKQIEGCYWDFKERKWRYTATEEVYAQIKRIFYPNLQDVGVSDFLENHKIAVGENKSFQNLDSVNEDDLIELPSKFKAMKHQLVAQTLAIRHAGFGLFMEVGTGKSLVAINVAGYHFERSGYDRVLVVAPLGLLFNWKNEIEACSAYPHDITILQGSTEQKRKALANAEHHKGHIQWIMVNYDALAKLEQDLSHYRFQTIIADEAHRIGTFDIQASQALQGISRLSKVRLALTGSPVSGSPLKAFGIYQFIDKRVFGTNFYRFRDTYAIMKQLPGRRFKIVAGYKNLNDMSERMYQCAYRCTAEEALDLPGKMNIVLPVQLEQKAMDLYKRLEAEAVAETERGTITTDNILTFILRAAQITGGYVTTTDGKVINVSTAKIDVLRDLCNDLLENGERKIVIFCRFRAEIDAVVNMAKKMKQRCHVIHGDIGIADRNRMVNDFQTKADTRLFCIQSRTGSEGLTLTKADVCIFMSLDYSAIAYEQACGRIYRKGQNKKVTYYHLLASGTVDEDIYSALHKKADVAKKVADRFKKL